MQIYIFVYIYLIEIEIKKLKKLFKTKKIYIYTTV